MLTVDERVSICLSICVSHLIYRPQLQHAAGAAGLPWAGYIDRLQSSALSSSGAAVRRGAANADVMFIAAVEGRAQKHNPFTCRRLRCRQCARNSTAAVNKVAKHTLITLLI